MCRFNTLQGGDGINLPTLDFGFDLAQGRFNAGHRAGQFRVLPGLDRGLRLGKVLRRFDDGRVQAVAGIIQMGGNLGDGVQQDIGLVQALLRRPDGDGGEAALARSELLLGGGRGILHKGQSFLGLCDVVCDLHQRAVRVLGAQSSQ